MQNGQDQEDQPGKADHTRSANILKSGKYKAGDRIPTEKEELSEDLGVGRNSIREATKSLVLLGVLESTPGKGTFLRKDPDTIDLNASNPFNSMGSVTLQELIDARKLIEVPAAGLAALNVKEHPELAEKLDQATRHLSRDTYFLKDKDGYNTEEGSSFHKTIVELSGNRVLVKMMESIYEELHRARDLFPVTEAEFDNEMDFHAQIVTAIKAGDDVAAREAMEAHLENTESIYAVKQSL